MSAGVLDIVIEQGATFDRTINVEDSLGNPVNLSDVTSVRGQVRKSHSSSDSYAFTLAVTSATGGVISWLMSSTVSASIPITAQQDYVYDVELVRASSVERLLQGIATISPEVTR
jgi:hypothetical protein